MELKSSILMLMLMGMSTSSTSYIPVSPIGQNPTPTIDDITPPERSPSIETTPTSIPSQVLVENSRASELKTVDNINDTPSDTSGAFFVFLPVGVLIIIVYYDSRRSKTEEDDTRLSTASSSVTELMVTPLENIDVLASPRQKTPVPSLTLKSLNTSQSSKSRPLPKTQESPTTRTLVSRHSYSSPWLAKQHVIDVSMSDMSSILRTDQQPSSLQRQRSLMQALKLRLDTKMNAGSSSQGPLDPPSALPPPIIRFINRMSPSPVNSPKPLVQPTFKKKSLFTMNTPPHKSVLSSNFSSLNDSDLSFISDVEL